MNKYKNFPAKAIKAFLDDPTFAKLNMIFYDCKLGLSGSTCNECPFNWRMTCPPPRPNSFWWLSIALKNGKVTLSTVVLMYSEALAIYEQQQKAKKKWWRFWK